MTTPDAINLSQAAPGGSCLSRSDGRGRQLPEARSGDSLSDPRSDPIRALGHAAMSFKTAVCNCMEVRLEDKLKRRQEGPDPSAEDAAVRWPPSEEAVQGLERIMGVA